MKNVKPILELLLEHENAGTLHKLIKELTGYDHLVSPCYWCDAPEMSTQSLNDGSKQLVCGCCRQRSARYGNEQELIERYNRFYERLKDI